MLLKSLTPMADKNGIFFTLGVSQVNALTYLLFASFNVLKKKFLFWGLSW